MKFKYLSADFLASYNEIMEQIEGRQAELDTIFADKIEDLVKREKLRLNKIAPQYFEVGEKVKVKGLKKTFTIVDTYIDFDVEVNELDEFGRPYYGPGRYFSIQSERDEDAVTCEGSFRIYVVESSPNVIQSDWGIESVTDRFYQEDLVKIK